MLHRMKCKTVPVLLLGAALVMGLFSAGCGEIMEETEVPWEPEEVEENAEVEENEE